MDEAPTVTILVPGALRRYCEGASELTLAAATVGAALEDLSRSQSDLYRNICDDAGKVRRHINVFVNSAHLRDLDGLDTALVAGDVVTILPSVSGG